MKNAESPYKASMPPRFAAPSIFFIIVASVYLFFLVTGFNSANITFTRLSRGVANLGAFFSKAIPPDTSRTVPLLKSIFQTFQMVIVGTSFGVLLSIPISLLASATTNPSKVTRLVVRGFVTTMRTVPDLIWALIFVISVGLGPFAGILTIIVDTIGFSARFFAERIDEIDHGPPQALESTGATRFSVICGAILPMSFPSMVGTSLYAVEKGIRSAVVLGLVGAGGIGIELSTSMSLRRFDEAFMIILMILAIVLIVEQISSRIRMKVI